MPILNTSPNTSSFEVSQAFYGGRNMFKARQRVNLVSGTYYQALVGRLPPRCRVVHAIVSNQAAISVVGGLTTAATNAPDTIGVLMFPTTATAPVTAPPTTSSASHPTGTNGHLLQRSTSTASNAFKRGAPNIIGGSATGVPAILPENTTSVEAFLAVVPISTNSNRVQMNGTNTDSNMFFGTDTNATTNTTTYACGSVDVVLYYESLDDFPAFP